MSEDISRERKKELEQMDPFQENLLKAMAFAKEFKKQIIIILSAAIVVILVFSGVIYSFNKAEAQASRLVATALEAYAKSDDSEKAFVQAETDFSLILKEYANTNAGRLAKIQFAKMCYDAGRFDLSYQYYKESMELFKNDPVLQQFLFASMGNVLIALDRPDDAKEFFQKIEKGKADLLKDEARFKLALLNEKQGNQVESKDLYERIVKEHAGSLYLPLAKAKISDQN